ncbi:response regulator [Roseovarius sp. C7]|uniref:response regulator n=1 Tax=Roseovarius sp. C7 TaxID=3398643 RepID=UPI0039F69FCD
MRILAVDDDPIILTLLGEVLRAAGFTDVVTAESGVQALRAIAETDTPFDCFLFDIQMPEMDGIELVQEVRKFADYGSTPILMITAMSQRKYIDAAFAAGASDYITKPFEIGEVHARLRLVSSLAETRRAGGNPDALEAVTENRPADLVQRVKLHDVDGFIDYLAVENYLLQVSRLSLIGMRAFGVVIPEMKRVLGHSTRYEYEAAVADVAEAISDTIKPLPFFAAHAGGGEFICVLLNSNNFDPEEFNQRLNETITDMDLYHSNGAPMSLRAVVGEDFSLKLKSPKGVSQTLVQALAAAEMAQHQPARREPPKSSLLQLFGFG